MAQALLATKLTGNKRSKAPALPGRPDMRQLGSIGLESSAGLVYDSTIRELRGSKAFQHYREMADHSAVIGACLFAIEMLIRKVKWTFEVPKVGGEGEKEHAELLNGMLGDMSVSWEDTVAEILSMLTYGFAYLEMVYKVRKGPNERNSSYRSRFTDGLVGWRKWVLIPQETLLRWEWDDEGGVRAFVQRAPNDTKDRAIPIEKALLFRTKVSRNNPQGRSLLLNAYYPWQFVKRTMEIEGIGVERDLAGLPMALVPPEYLDPQAPAEDKALLQALKDLVTSVRRNAQEGIIFPMAHDEHNNPLFEFKLLATGGMRQFDTNKIIERYERRMAMSLLSDFILMGHERVGSLALSRDKTTLIGRALAGILASIAAVINRHAVPRLYQLNGWDPEVTCQITPGDVENADIKNLGVYLRNLASVGLVTPDPGLEAALREAGGLPMIDPEYQLGPGELPAAAGGQQPGADDEKGDNEDAAQKSEDEPADDDELDNALKAISAATRNKNTRAKKRAPRAAKKAA